MIVPVNITAASPDPALLDLPWDTGLEDWPQEVIAALPRGVSRHIVRFVKLSSGVVAIKEINQIYAEREYELLRQLNSLDIPSVVPVGVVTGRFDKNGDELDACLITKHLRFSMPYRAIFSQSMRKGTAKRLIDSLALLLVQLHLQGFYWGDVSLSNTLFRRDAEQFTAYLVDAETGDLHPQLTEGQRNYDIDLARTNIIGEMMDLESGELLGEDLDPMWAGDRLLKRYNELWSAIHDEDIIRDNRRHNVEKRINRLNDLGFDVSELSMTADADGTTVHIQPRVVDAGHHTRQLLRLTGLDVHEHQAQRLLNDITTYRLETDQLDTDMEFVAHDWLINMYEPTIRAIPRSMREKLEPAQVYHEVLDHRWFLSEKEKQDIPMPEAVESYITHVLSHRRDEASLIGVETQQLPAVPDL